MRYHYHGYTPLPGAQVQYLIYSESGALLGAISFSAATWALRPRDGFIGWNKKQLNRQFRKSRNVNRFAHWVELTTPDPLKRPPGYEHHNSAFQYHYFAQTHVEAVILLQNLKR
ncbi:Druantia anti-phage system protein DruA [Desulfosporosinus sp. I2]|uniref:Druantia anti-phage system protein DruA n=1 Tax=Desulfosporosinus sp. I2 TaxID=1617025 RepID=UPI0009E235D4|nr:Druantia anti-phage system protein DruA [Desulfosporosinus sp. I2]